MKIAIDIQALQTRNSRNRGIGRYTKSVLEALITDNNASSYHLFANGTLPEPDFNTQICSYENIHYQHIGSSPINDLVLRTAILSKDVDAIFVPSPMEGLDSTIPDYKSFSKQLFVICYDLIPLIFADRYLCDPNMKTLYMERLKNVQNADFIFAISESTRQDVIKYLNISPNKVLNVSGGVSPFFTPIHRNEHLFWLNKFSEKFNITKKFILYTGGEDWRKNIEGLVQSFAKLPLSLRNEYQLVVACKVSDFFAQEVRKIALKLGVNDSLILTNYITDEELRALYSTCSLFVFPSYYEGFGLPLLEAISCGAPAITSNNSSLIEIVTSTEQLFDVHSLEDMAIVMKNVLTDENFRRKLSDDAVKQASKFTWKSVAEKISDVFADYQPLNRVSINFNRISTSELNPNLAFFSPFSPAKSGIADYSQDLLPYLSEHFNLDLYHDENYLPNAVSEYNAFNNFTFEERLKTVNYEGIIYQFGNSSYHSYMYWLLMRYPGIVVLHDIYLGGLINYMDKNYPELNITLDNELKHNYGEEKTTKIINLLQQGKLNIDNLPESELYVNRRIFSRSLGVVLHSQWAFKYATEKFSHENECIKHIPQLMPQYKSSGMSIKDLRGKLGIPQDSLVISTFGFVNATKRPIEILHAFKKYLAVNPSSYLIFAGGTDYLGSTDIEYEIKKLNLQKRVKVTGFVDMADFYRYIEISDICLNLRFPFNGESSASLLRILSLGKPVIVTDVGSFSDFPNDVVFKIPQPKQSDEVEEIVKALLVLSENVDYRNSLSNNALEYILREHSPERCARLYADFFKEVKFSIQAKRKLLADYVGREAAKYSSENPENLLMYLAKMI